MAWTKAHLNGKCHFDPLGIFVDEVDIRAPDKTVTARRQLDSIFLFAVGSSFYSFSSFGLVRVRWAAYQPWNIIIIIYLP